MNYIQVYKRFRANGEAAINALRNAKTVGRFEELEAQGKVRLIQEPEQESYFDVYGEPDSEKERKSLEHYLELYGCYWVASEYECSCETHWEQADSIGMCVYNDPLDPFENCYVPDLMAGAIAAYEARKSE